MGRMTEPARPSLVDEQFAFFEDPYQAERKTQFRQLQEQALRGDREAKRELRRAGLIRWEQDGRRVI